MNTLHFAFALSAALVTTAYAQPAMTIYGTFKEANDETNNEQIAKKPFAGTNYQSVSYTHLTLPTSDLV